MVNVSGCAPPPYEIPTAFVEDLTKLGPLLNAGNELGAFVQGIFERHLTIQPTDSDFKKVAYLMLGRGFKTFQAVWTLCLNGCGADGLALCGSMFENVVDLAYIARARFKRSPRYVQYEQVDKYYQAQKILARKRLPKGTRERFRGYELKLRPQTQHLLHHYKERSLGWSQKTLKQRAKAVGLGLEYDQLYWILCLYKHTLPAGAGGFMLTHEEGVDVTYGLNLKGVYQAACFAANYLLKLCTLVDSAYQLGIATGLQTLSTRLGTAAAEVLKAHPGLIG